MQNKEFGEVVTYRFKILFPETGNLEAVNRIDLREVLEGFGANFSQLNVAHHKSLSSFQQSNSKDGVIAAWGGEFYQKYTKFCRAWVVKFESDPDHRKLPMLRNIDSQSSRKPSKSKISGMLHFLHFITAYAAGDLDFARLKEYFEVMDTNGYLWQEGMFDQERSKIKVDRKMIKMGSMPPGFAGDAWKFLESHSIK